MHQPSEFEDASHDSSGIDSSNSCAGANNKSTRNLKVRKFAPITPNNHLNTKNSAEDYLVSARFCFHY